MKKTALRGLALGLLAGASIVSAATTCTAGNELSPGSPNGQVGNSCSLTFDGLTFSNFQYNIVSQTTSSTQALSVTLGAFGLVGSDIVLNFNPNLVNNGNNQGIYDIHFSYEVTGVQLGASLSDFGTDASIQETDCLGGIAALNSGCTGTILWNVTAGSLGTSSSSDTCGPGTATTGTGTSLCAWGASQSNVWIWKDISIGVTMSGGQTVLNSDDHLTSFSEDSLVPEPMTLSLLGAGLVGLGLIGRRLRK